jgi:hypothetical protein
LSTHAQPGVADDEMPRFIHRAHATDAAHHEEY